MIKTACGIDLLYPAHKVAIYGRLEFRMRKKIFCLFLSLCITIIGTASTGLAENYVLPEGIVYHENPSKIYDFEDFTDENDFGKTDSTYANWTASPKKKGNFSAVNIDDEHGNSVRIVQNNTGEALINYKVAEEFQRKDFERLQIDASIYIIGGGYLKLLFKNDAGTTVTSELSRFSTAKNGIVEWLIPQESESGAEAFEKIYDYEVNQWYDTRFVIDGITDTYDLYIKTDTDEEYTLVAENKSLYSVNDYSKPADINSYTVLRFSTKDSGASNGYIFDNLKITSYNKTETLENIRVYNSNNEESGFPENVFTNTSRIELDFSGEMDEASFGEITLKKSEDAGDDVVEITTEKIEGSNTYVVTLRDILEPNTAYTLDLSGVKTKGLLSLDKRQQTISFVTGEAQNYLPGITVNSIKNGQLCEAGKSILIDATIEDFDGTVENVTMAYADASGNYTDLAVTVGENNRYSAILEMPKSGEYSLKISATDDKGEISYCTMDFTVAERTLPNIELLSPEEGSVFSVGDTFTVEVCAEKSNIGQSIDRVEFYKKSEDNNIFIGEAAQTDGVYSCEVTVSADESYSLVVRVIENDGYAFDKEFTWEVNPAEAYTSEKLLSYDFENYNSMDTPGDQVYPNSWFWEGGSPRFTPAQFDDDYGTSLKIERPAGYNGFSQALMNVTGVTLDKRCEMSMDLRMVNCAAILARCGDDLLLGSFNNGQLELEDYNETTEQTERVTVGSYPIDKWFNMKWIFNFDKDTFDIYIDNKSVVQNWKMRPTESKKRPTGNFSSLNTLYFREGNGMQYFCLDNVTLYTQVKTVAIKETSAVDIAGNKIADLTNLPLSTKKLAFTFDRAISTASLSEVKFTAGEREVPFNGIYDEQALTYTVDFLEPIVGGETYMLDLSGVMSSAGKPLDLKSQQISFVSEKYDTRIVNFIDSTSNEITSLEGDSLSGYINVTNNTSNSIDCTIVAVAYAGEKMQDISLEKKSINGYKTEQVPVSLNIAGADKVRIYVLKNDIKNLDRIADYYEICR